MRLLLIGGSGNVGSFTTPYLRRQHQIRVLDPSPPRHDVDYIEGSIADPEALDRALDGVDAFINMTMKSGQGGFSTDANTTQIIDNYTVNCMGLHLLLHIACRHGVKRGIHTSTMTAHDRNRGYYASEEAVPLDGLSVYGFSKGLGERICRYFAQHFDMSLAIFRITGPRTRDAFLQEARNPPHYPRPGLYFTDEEDMARAYLAGLEHLGQGHGRCDTFFISGDADHREMNMSKARAILGWEPRSHELLESSEGPEAG